MLSESLVFWSLEELSILDSDGSKTMIFFLLSNFFKPLDEHRARMNNRTGKAEAKFVLGQNKVIVCVVK